MICDILINAQHDPGCILGGESYTLNGNVRAGKGNFLVAEADESDGSHLFIRPRYGIITNVDREHLDYYKDTEGVTRSSRAFMQNIEPNGMLFALIDDRFLR